MAVNTWNNSALECHVGSSCYSGMWILKVKSSLIKWAGGLNNLTADRKCNRTFNVQPAEWKRGFAWHRTISKMGCVRGRVGAVWGGSHSCGRTN